MNRQALRSCMPSKVKFVIRDESNVSTCRDVRGDEGTETHFDGLAMLVAAA